MYYSPLLLLLCCVFSPLRNSLLGPERAVFYFVWGSKWERLKGATAKKRPENGGKGLPDPHLFLGSRFTALHKRHAMTPDTREPGLWGQTGKSQFLLPFLNIVFLLKSSEKHFLKKENGAVLINGRLFVSLLQDREKVSPVPGPTTCGAKQGWRNVAHPALQNKQRDWSWMAAHETLPVRAVMHPRGTAKSSICPRSGCGRPETVRHVFRECRVAGDPWAATGPLTCPSLPAGEVRPLEYRVAVHGVGQRLESTSRGLFTALWLTLNSVKAALWTSRNLLVGTRVTEPLLALSGWEHLRSGRPRASPIGGGRGHTQEGPGHHGP